METSITAIVCSYRRPKHLEACLSSLDQQGCPGLRVLVVGVEDDEETSLVVQASAADLVCQSHAEGISAARNLGLKKSSSSVVAFIDDDARARFGWAAGLQAALGSPRTAGVGGPVFDSTTGLQVVRPWRVDPFGITHDSTEVGNGSFMPTLNGCNMAFKRDALAAIGGFDPYYRYYYDETDVCVRLFRRGYAIEFAEDAVVDHDFAEGPTRERFLYFSSRMRAYFSLKNFHGQVPDGRLLFAQGVTVRQDFRAYRRLQSRYPGFGGFCRASKELVIGRSQGIMDGLLARRSQEASDPKSRPGEVQ